MKRNSASNDKPVADKTIHIQLPEGRIKLRVVLLILLLVLAAVSFAVGINSLVGTDPGLQEISVLSGEMNAGGDFTFYYYLGYGGSDASDERREVRSLYTQAATDAFEIFTADVEVDGRSNLWYLNRHPNEEIVVDAALYSALELVEESGMRYIYLAPLYEQYYALFNSNDDAEAAQYDPRYDSAQGEFFAAVSAYANDPGQVDIELLGGNRVRLSVSDEYLSFAEANGVEVFADFAWMKNAFIADYIASELVSAGYTHGALFSSDGFMRCLDGETGAEYSFTFSHRDGGTVTELASLSFAGTVSMVYLHDYPLSGDESPDYYVYSDGTIRSQFLDPADGLDRTCVPELAAYSYGFSCAEVALRLAPEFISGSFDVKKLEELEESGISVYYVQNGTLHCTSE